MTAKESLERQVADYYATEAPQRAPDWVLRSALETIDKTSQRRVFIPAPWRIPHMNSFAKVAIAAVAVIAVGIAGLSFLRPASPTGVGGLPTASPSPSSSPTPSPSPSVSFASPPPLTETFTSQLHGFSIAYPTGWVTAPATELLTAPGLTFLSPDVDYIYDGPLTSDLFLALASQPLGDKAPETWVTDFLSSFDDGCDAQREPISVDGTNGVICGGNLFATAVGGRGYFVRSYTGDGLPAELAPSYDETWFRSVLATMQLRPADAVETLGSPSASP